MVFTRKKLSFKIYQHNRKNPFKNANESELEIILYTKKHKKGDN